MSWYTDVSTWTKKPPAIQVYNEQGESFDYLPERTCKLERQKHERPGYPAFSTYRCSSCGRTYISADAPDIGEYCAECGAKVVE